MKDTKTNFSAARYRSLYFNGEPPALREATALQRFINYVTDNLLMQFVINWILFYVLADGLAAVSPDVASSLASKNHN